MTNITSTCNGIFLFREHAKSLMRNSSGGNINSFWNVEFLCGDRRFNCQSTNKVLDHHSTGDAKNSR